MCDQYNEFVSESYCLKCDCKVENGDLSEENTEEVALCKNCSFYVKNENSNFYGQCIKKGLRNEDGYCNEYKR